jgi:hypothetical protein
MNDADYEILVHMMNGGHPPDFAVRLLEDICARTGLDWKARHVYLQKRRSKSGGDSWQAVLSIDGFRAVGARHPDYAGQEGPFWVSGPDAVWSDIPPEGKPYAAKVGIKKRNGITTWGVAKYADYAVTGPGGMMWDKFSSTMIAKCAEMLAWRKTLPETFGGLYGDTELKITEEKSGPKEALHKAEILDEVLPPPDAGERGNLKQLYLDRITAVKSRPELLAIGQEIMRDKGLDPADTFALHKVYNDTKKNKGWE